MDATINGSDVTVMQYSSSDTGSLPERRLFTSTRWRPVQMLGSGGSGEVWVHQNTENTSEVRAVKTIQKAVAFNQQREILAATILNKVSTLVASVLFRVQN